MPHCHSCYATSMTTLMKIQELSFAVKCRVHKNGIFDGVQSPPTKGADSLDWLQISTIFKCLRT